MIIKTILAMAIVYLAGWANRARGSSSFGFTKIVDYLLLCTALSILLGLNGTAALLFPLVAICTMIGYGEAWGKAINGLHMETKDWEDWQKITRPDNTKPYHSLIVYGFIHALLITPIIYFQPTVIFFALSLPLVWPLAVYLGSKTQDGKPWPWYAKTIRHNNWEKAEWILGWLMGLSALFTGLI